MIEPDRSQTTIWRMCIACWMPKATNTSPVYVILVAFPLQKWLHESMSMLRLHVYRLSCSSFSFFLLVIHLPGWFDLTVQISVKTHVYAFMYDVRYRSPSLI
jgi:hypothetical protein